MMKYCYLTKHLRTHKHLTIHIINLINSNIQIYLNLNIISLLIYLLYKLYYQHPINKILLMKTYKGLRLIINYMNLKLDQTLYNNQYLDQTNNHVKTKYKHLYYILNILDYQILLFYQFICIHNFPIYTLHLLIFIDMLINLTNCIVEHFYSKHINKYFYLYRIKY